MLPDDSLTDGVVTLRQWDPDEAGWYAAQVRDPEIQRFTRESPDLTEAEVRDAILTLARTREHAGLVVTSAADGALLGNAGLRRTSADGVGELSYWVAPAARGRGVATRAIRLLTGLAWSYGMREVRLHAHVDNIGSQRAAERAGFTRGSVERAVPVGDTTWDIVWYSVARPTAPPAP